MKRILHIVGTMNMGGQETFIMNIYRKMDRNNIQFDFVVHEEKRGYYDDEIEKLGGKIYRITQIKKNPIKHCKELYDIIKKNNYKIVHRHTSNPITFVDLLSAKLAKANRVIVHSHSSSWENKNYSKIFRPFINAFSDIRLACSESAGKWLYGKKNFEIIPNSIDTMKFLFSSEKREEVRRRYNISSNTILLGNIAAFRKEKNQLWLLKCLKEFLKSSNEYKLMLCGDGNLKNEAQDYVKHNELNDKVIFTGNVDSHEYYNAFDIFLMPSIYEGLGIVLIEAQISNLPCIASDAIQEEVIIDSFLKRIPLDETEWINEIKNTKMWKRKIIKEKKYEKYKIENLVNRMMNIYCVEE